jgi:L-threonylcarbamoyladenylate synthase
MIVQKSLIAKELVAQKIRDKKVLIIPTDTVYGFSGIVPDTDAIIRKIKGREETKPFIQLIGNPTDIYNYTNNNIPSELLSYWPGPLTIIVNDKMGKSTTAFRCPGDLWLRSVINLLGEPVFSTSVNRSGMPIINDVVEMEKEFGTEVDCIIDGGEMGNGIPSTLVDISKGIITVLRQGAVKISSIDSK